MTKLTTAEAFEIAKAHLRAAHARAIGSYETVRRHNDEIKRLQDLIDVEAGKIRDEMAAANENIEGELGRTKLPTKDGPLVPALLKPISPEQMILAVEGDHLFVRQLEPVKGKQVYVEHLYGPPDEENQRTCVACSKSAPDADGNPSGCNGRIMWPSVNVAPIAEEAPVE